MKYYGTVNMYNLRGAGGETPDKDEILINIIDHEEDKDFLNDIKDNLDDAISAALDLVKCDFEVTSTDSDGANGKFSILFETNRELLENEIEMLNTCIKELSEDCYWSGCLNKLELHKM